MRDSAKEGWREPTPLPYESTSADLDSFIDDLLQGMDTEFPPSKPVYRPTPATSSGAGIPRARASTSTPTSTSASASTSTLSQGGDQKPWRKVTPATAPPFSSFSSSGDSSAVERRRSEWQPDRQSDRQSNRQSNRQQQQQQGSFGESRASASDKDEIDSVIDNLDDWVKSSGEGGTLSIPRGAPVSQSSMAYIDDALGDLDGESS